MEGNRSLTDQIRDWYERTPWAQQAYRRLSADLDTVAAQVKSATSRLMETVGPIIDPPSAVPTPPEESAAAGPSETDPSSAGDRPPE